MFVRINKIISIIIAVVFVTNSIGYASPNCTIHSPQFICIPELYGRIDNPVRCELSTVNSPKQPLVVLVKDAHCNYEAQKNITKILDILIKDYKIDLVGIEGASGNVDPSVIADSSDSERRKWTADKYLKKGWLIASEALAMERGKDCGFGIWGVEDFKLYLNDLRILRDVYKGSSDAERFMEIANNLIYSLKNKIYPKEAIEYDKKINGYRNNKLSLTELMEYLNRQKSVSKNHKNLNFALRVLKLEKMIDFKKIEEERNELIKECENNLPKEELVQLVRNSLSYKLGKISSIEYYEYIKQFINPISGLKSKINLYRYIRNIKLNSKIDEDALFAEIDSLIENIYKNYLHDEISMKLHNFSEYIYYLNKLLRLEVTRDELKRYRDSVFKIIDVVEFIKIQASLYNIDIPFEFRDEGFISQVDVFYKQPEEFYKYAMERDKVFVENLISRMKYTNKDKAVIIVGGFHADGVKELLERNEVRVTIVTPSITREDQEAKKIYLERMMDERIDPDRLLAEMGINNLGTMAVTATNMQKLFEPELETIRDESVRDELGSALDKARTPADFAKSVEDIIRRIESSEIYVDEYARELTIRLLDALRKKASDQQAQWPVEKGKENTGARSESEQIRDLFRTHGEVVNMRQGDELFSFGAPPDYVYYVVNGNLEVVEPDKVLGHDSVVGEIAAMESQRARTATVTCGTDATLLRIRVDTFRRLINDPSRASLKEYLLEMAIRRKDEWPKIMGKISAINVEEKYMPLIEILLKDDRTRNEIFHLAGISGDNIEIEDVQFAGEGSIKYVVAIRVKVNGKSGIIGIRFYGSKLFRSISQTDKEAEAEVRQFQEFSKLDGTAIDIYGYISATSWFETENFQYYYAFLNADVAGFSVGEYIPFRMSQLKPEDTGIRPEHYADLIATIVRAWLLKCGEDGMGNIVGPVISDLKLENFVMDDMEELGQKIKYLDLGALEFVSFNALIYRIEEFVNNYLLPEVDAKQQDIFRGFGDAISKYVAEKIVNNADLDDNAKMARLNILYNLIISNIGVVQSLRDILGDSADEIRREIHSIQSREGLREIPDNVIDKQEAGYENKDSNLEIREALGKGNFACVDGNLMAVNNIGLYAMIQGNELTEGEKEILRKVTSELDDADKKILEGLLIIFIPGLSAHYSRQKYNQIYFDRNLLSNPKYIEDLRWQAHHEVQEREIVRDGMSVGEAHARLIREELRVRFKINIEDDLDGVLAQKARDLLRVLTLDGEITEDEIGVIIDKAKMAVDIFNRYNELGLPEDFAKRLDLVQEIVAMQCAIEALGKNNIPGFVNRLIEELGCDEKIVQGLIMDLYNYDGYDDYFMLMLDGIRTMFSVDEKHGADKYLRMLDEYKYRKTQIKGKFNINKTRFTGGGDEMYNTLMDYLKKGDKELLDEVADIVARYLTYGENESENEILNLFKNTAIRSQVKEGIGKLISRKDLVRREKPQSTLPDDMPKEKFARAKKGYELAARLVDKKTGLGLRWREGMPLIVDSRYITVKQGDVYVIDPMAEQLLWLLQGARAELNILYKNEDEKKAIGRWFSEKDIRTNFITEYPDEYEKAVSILTHETLDGLKVPEGHRVIRGTESGEDDLILISRMAAVLSRENIGETRDDFEKLLKGYYGNSKREEDINSIVDDIMKNIGDGLGAIIIILPTIAPFVKAYYNILKQTMKMTAEAA